MVDTSRYSFVVFTATDMFSVRQSIYSLLTAFPNALITVLQHAPQKSLKQLLKSQKRNLKRHGWRWIPYQTLDIASRVGAKLTQQNQPSPSEVGIHFGKAELLSTDRVQWHVFQSIHSPDALALVASIKPDLGISLAAPILKPSIFEIPRLGTLNLHKGRVPDYKGMPPAFWELRAGEKYVGCTVHFVSEKLDAGDVVLEQLVPIPQFATVKGMQLTLDQVGVEMMSRAAAEVLSGSATPWKQTHGGSTNSRPPLALERTVNRALSLRSGQSNDAKSLVKEVYFGLYGRAYAPVRDFLRPQSRSSRVVVLLYHRINDELRDGVTNGIEQFDQHMGILSKSANVVSLRSLLNPDAYQQPTRKPKVVVTFDDGYEDNYSVAAPILERHGIHATFFVSTGLMGTTRAFDHDQTKLGRGLPNMTWDQLRDLKARGFDIGSHTVNHARISTLQTPDLERELRDSKATLERELGEDSTLFAYPFGGLRDSNPEANRAVFAAGYQMCCSAYGGRNDTVNLTNIKRSTVSFAHNKEAFWALVNGFSKVREASKKASYEA
jgi:peptidoglycan/xylan/chitin deacetylase (PgdA/CDA1 family)